MLLRYFIVLIISFPTFANITFDNVEKSTQQQLLNAIKKGVPIYASDWNTGEVSHLKLERVTKVIQIGNQFSVCTGQTTLYEIQFKCFKGQACQFVTDGGITKGRFNIAKCVVE